jgi:hypothetical protein
MTGLNGDVPFSGEVYVWTFPGCPILVYFHKTIIERFANELSRSPSKGESGGLLLGERQGLITHVVDFCPVSCDSPGAEYLPSIPCFQRYFGQPRLPLPPRAEAAAQMTGLDGDIPFSGETVSSVVGYYRLQNRGVNQLSPEDLAVIDRYFPDVGNVHLVLGATEEGPNMTGVFFRENGLVHTISYMEFACDPPLLKMRRLPIVREPDRPQAVSTAEPAPDQQPRLPLPPRAEAAALMTGPDGDIPCSGETLFRNFMPTKQRVPRLVLLLLIALILLILTTAAVAGYFSGRNHV